MSDGFLREGDLLFDLAKPQIYRDFCKMLGLEKANIAFDIADERRTLQNMDTEKVYTFVNVSGAWKFTEVE